jgi:erythronate-4-phosphate dehydrogenase
LLDGGAVKFVATATIGMDHIDREYIEKNNIGFASAPGSNAESVAQYLTAAMLVLARRGGYELRGKTLGVVGVGNTGSRVARNAEAIGMNVLLNDPPLQRETGDAKYRPLDNLFEADFITLHVPLEKGGQDPTLHLANEEFLKQMKPGAVLINSSRGAVADNAAILAALREKQIAGCVLDVWENEPTIDMDLLGAVDIGTPHIAGYSFDGKVRGCEMIYNAACAHFGIDKPWTLADSLPAAEFPQLNLKTDDRSERGILDEAVKTIYDIERDDADLRALAELPADARGPAFDRLRKEYPRRREFDLTEIALELKDPKIARMLKAIRFQVDAELSSAARPKRL